MSSTKRMEDMLKATKDMLDAERRKCNALERTSEDRIRELERALLKANTMVQQADRVRQDVERRSDARIEDLKERLDYAQTSRRRCVSLCVHCSCRSAFMTGNVQLAELHALRQDLANRRGGWLSLLRGSIACALCAFCLPRNVRPKHCTRGPRCAWICGGSPRLH
jgi:hypothetical protein